MIAKKKRNYEDRPKDIKPVPESVAHSGPWEVRVAEQSGKIGVNLEGKKLVLPLDSSDLAQSLRNQAYTALAVDREDKFPRKKQVAKTPEEGAWGSTLKSVYLNEYARSKQVDIDHLPINTIIPETEAKRAMRYVELASLGDRALPEMDHILKAMEKPQDLINASATTISRLAQLGRDNKKINPVAIREIIQNLIQLFPAEAGEGFQQETAPASKPEGEEPNRPDIVKEDNGWGAMEILDLPRGLKHKSARVKRKSRASLVGAFKFPHRASYVTSDGRCFVLRKRKEGGGAVLIDLSGSMDWNESDIGELLNHAPTAIVAGYGSLPRDTSSGRLAIIAKDGTIGDARTLRKAIGGGNVVDGPALKWLSEQPEPRIWVSDGCVTGKDEDRTKRLAYEAFGIVVKNRITRVEDLGGALMFFEKYKTRKKVR